MRRLFCGLVGLLLVLSGAAQVDETKLPDWTAEPEGNPRRVQVERLIDQARADEAGGGLAAAKVYQRIYRDAQRRQNRALALVLLGDQLAKDEDYYPAFEQYKLAVDSYATLLPLTLILRREFTVGEALETPPGNGLKMFTEGRNLRAVEVYDHVAKTTPYSELAAAALLRAGVILRWHNDYRGSVQRLRQLITDFPPEAGTPLTAKAMIQLAETLQEQAEYSDGDGRLTRDARSVLQRFLRSYSEAHPDRPTAVRLLAQLDVQEAKRLLYLARFYQVPSHQSLSASRRYLNLLVTEFAETPQAVEAAAMLALLPAEEPAAEPETTIVPPATVTPAVPVTPPTTVAPPAGGAVQPPTAGSDTTPPEAPRPPRRKGSEKWLLPIDEGI